MFANSLRRVNVNQVMRSGYSKLIFGWIMILRGLPVSKILYLLVMALLLVAFRQPQVILSPSALHVLVWFARPAPLHSLTSLCTGLVSADRITSKITM